MSQSSRLFQKPTEVSTITHPETGAVSGTETADSAVHPVAPAPKFQLGYRKYLDGLRGISILLVLIFHSDLPWGKGGFIGVDIFFVLSGFLITSLLWQEWEVRGSISLKNFYARRALRLLPAIVAVVTVYGVIKIAFGPPGTATHAIHAILATLFYVMNWTAALGWKEIDDIRGLSHTWSLSIEEQFYLLWPILFIVLLRLKRNRLWLLIVLLAGIVTPTLLRFWLWDVPATSKRLYFGFDTRADGLLLGCLVALLACWGWLPTSIRWRRIFTVLAAGAALYLTYLATGIPFTDGYPTTERFLYRNGGITAVDLSATIILVYLLVDSPRRILAFFESELLVWIGRLSYGLYLWHGPIFLGLFSIGIVEAVADLICPIPQIRHLYLAVGIATLSFYFIEKPFLQMKKRFEVPH